MNGDTKIGARIGRLSCKDQSQILSLNYSMNHFRLSTCHVSIVIALSGHETRLPRFTKSRICVGEARWVGKRN